MSDIKVVDVAPHSFKTEKNGWEKCHLSLQPKLKTLRSGDHVKILSRDKNGWIDDISIIPFSDIALSRKNSFQGDLSARERLKDKCLDIVFTNYSFNQANINVDEIREIGIRMSQRLFVELEDAGYYTW